MVRQPYTLSLCALLTSLLLCFSCSNRFVSGGYSTHWKKSGNDHVVTNRDLVYIETTLSWKRPVQSVEGGLVFPVETVPMCSEAAWGVEVDLYRREAASRLNWGNGAIIGGLVTGLLAGAIIPPVLVFNDTMEDEKRDRIIMTGAAFPMAMMTIGGVLSIAAPKARGPSNHPALNRVLERGPKSRWENSDQQCHRFQDSLQSGDGHLPDLIATLQAGSMPKIVIPMGWADENSLQIQGDDWKLYGAWMRECAHDSVGTVTVELSKPSPPVRYIDPQLPPPPQEVVQRAGDSHYWKPFSQSFKISAPRSSLRVFELPDTNLAKEIEACVDRAIQRCLAGQSRYCEQAERNAETDAERRVFRAMQGAR